MIPRVDFPAWKGFSPLEPRNEETTPLVLSYGAVGKPSPLPPSESSFQEDAIIRYVQPGLVFAHHNCLSCSWESGNSCFVHQEFPDFACVGF
jgi:hypothetical protein